MEVICPECGESKAIRGRRVDGLIRLTCERCDARWMRDPTPQCPTCGNFELRTVPLAILEKGRGTQLSIVGTRPINLCIACDAARLERWHRNRPNPLMPSQLPTARDS